MRRLLIESAWHHRAAYRNPGPTMRARWGLHISFLHWLKRQPDNACARMFVAGLGSQTAYTTNSRSSLISSRVDT